MVGIIIVTHGKMGQGMLGSMHMITGEQAQVATVELEEEYSPEHLSELVNDALELVDDGSGVLIMVDLFGATPFNVSARLYLESERQIEILTGVNLPMLVETVVSRAENDLKSVYDIAYQAGVSGIRTLPDTIKNSKK